MDSLDSATETSTVIALATRAVDNSRLVGRLGTCRQDVPEAISSYLRAIGNRWQSSRIRQPFPAARTALGRSAATAGVSGLARTIERWICASWLFRGLTAEPEPEVTVIDLREAMTIGPVIAILDLLAGGRPSSTLHRMFSDVVDYARATPIRACSLGLLVATAVGLALQMALGTFGPAGVIGTTVVTGLAALGLRNDTSWERLRETRPVRLLVAALEPPEPFDETGGRTADSDEPTSSSSE